MTDVPPSKRNEWGQRGNLPLPPIKRAPGGAPLCRWCWDPVPKGRLYWCSKGCVTDYRQRADWNFIREQIIERDKVCRSCGGARYSCRGGRYRAGVGYGPQTTRRCREDFHGVIVKQVWGWFNVIEHRWEVDHIVPVSEGGNDNPSNLRLLCAPCHHARTASWHRERAAGPQVALPLD